MTFYTLAIVVFLGSLGLGLAIVAAYTWTAEEDPEESLSEYGIGSTIGELNEREAKRGRR